MGNFYVNFSVRGADQKSVANCLWSANRKAYVAPAANNVTMFYEEESDSQDQSAIEEVACRVSESLELPVFVVLNHDDSILVYWLYDKGELVDSYDSAPGLLDGEKNPPDGGDAQALCKAFGVSGNLKKVRDILTTNRYTFAMDRHLDLASALSLGLPHDYVLTGYRSIEHGQRPEGIPGELVRIE